MEFLNSTISTNPQFSAIPFLTWKCRKKPSTLAIPDSRKIRLHSSFSRYLLRPTPSRTFQISAHFRRHSSRQNYLRKKLTQQQPLEVSQNIGHEFARNDSFDSNCEILDEVSGLHNESKLDSYSKDGENVGGSILDDSFSHSEGVKELEKEKKIGGSIMWNKLESWIEQYKKDSEFWGIGTGDIFTVYQDGEGKVERVVINEDEIMRRSRVDPLLDNEAEVLAEVNFKISFAKDLAREMESGSNVITKNSSVAKFLPSVGESHPKLMANESNVSQKNSSVAKFLLSGRESCVNLMEAIRGVSLKPLSNSRMLGVGVLVLCGLSLAWAIRGVFTVRKDNKKLTSLQKEMLLRKMKARKEEEKTTKGSVEVLQDPVEPKSMPFSRPQLNKEELLNSFIKVKGSNSLVEYTGVQDKEFNDKIEEIRAMARRARESERRGSSTGNGDEEDLQGSKDFSSLSSSPENGLPIQKMVYDGDSEETREYASFTGSNDDIGQSNDKAFDEKCETQVPTFHEEKLVRESSDLNAANLHGSQTGRTENSSRKKLKIIKSAKEAREYLSRKQKQDDRNYEHTDISIPLTSANVASGNTSQIMDLTDKVYDTSLSYTSEDCIKGGETPEGDIDGLNDLKNTRIPSGLTEVDHGVFLETEAVSTPIKNNKSEDTEIAERDVDGLLNDLKKIPSGSTEVDHGVLHKTEEVSTPLKNDKSEDTETAEVHEVGLNDLIKTRIPSCSTEVDHGFLLETEEVPGPLKYDISEDTETAEVDVGGLNDFKKTTIPSGSTEVDREVLLETEEVSTPLQNGKPEDTETLEGGVDGLSDLKKTRILSGLTEVDQGVLLETEKVSTPLKNDKSKDAETAEGDVDGFNDLKKTRIPSGVTEVNHGGLLETEEVYTPLKNDKSEDTNTATPNEVKGKTADLAQSGNNVNWIEKNFHEFEPIVKKMAVGFRDSYQLAREKASKGLGSEMDLGQLKSNVAESELEWMKDEKLSEIVFKVRDNELSGRDPFHLMDEEDKHLFFSGLEKKVEQENEKLLKLHEYFHSNIENLDYGADGISMFDPLEKIIPRWKVPPAEKNPEFLNNLVEQRKTLVAEGLKNSVISKKTAKETADKSQEPSSPENSFVAAREGGEVSNPTTKLQKDNLASSRTIIEGSDGSVRAGKRSGKEFWQHTKKWSKGFLESYNAESDPEVKAVMRDMGKDLERWITEKEIQEAADQMKKVPEKGQKILKKKLDKVKREMELFGPQAVVSKYREYAEEKEEDHLWWLDLSFVLCIELYTVEDGEQRVGLYSLEMAADLELDPKPYHVIAFEDAGDCKNLCYIIQAKMELLGNGNAFVVARPPKDAFREAKANGFSVTVIKKGQLQLNVDQTLEEVEELLIEIGSKIYHDKITKERSADMNGLMKGVFGFSGPPKRKRSKRKPKRRLKP